ncbi:hypothetical protein J6X15_02150 [Candidatus Saccharibacteria bacterium]|nr:hypothetical protein [Candidatus Saccharibacteria bacterium]MBP5656363.1 hypothetical protein [Candidatus Saccharibacteria bacterium]
MSRSQNKRPAPYNPQRCWVGDKNKICYPDEDTAEMSAYLVEAEHNLPSGTLSWYHCEYGDHWHLANTGDTGGVRRRK